VALFSSGMPLMDLVSLRESRSDASWHGRPKLSPAPTQIVPYLPAPRRAPELGHARAAANSPEPDYATAWRQLPREIVFINVETTGFGRADRIVTLGVVRLSTEPIGIATLHLVFNPGRRCSAEAARAHGFDDTTLGRQDPFGPYAAALSAYFAKAPLIVTHNAAFHLRSLNSEFAALGVPPIRVPNACTTLAYRALGLGGARLDEILAQLELQRRAKHSAVEDAWLTMQVYLWMNGCPWRLDFLWLDDPGPANFRAPPSRQR
jgi:DNA polymerase-3 subunit epsilon